jgi:hypothetical protein
MSISVAATTPQKPPPGVLGPAAIVSMRCTSATAMRQPLEQPQGRRGSTGPYIARRTGLKSPQCGQDTGSASASVIPSRSRPQRGGQLLLVVRLQRQLRHDDAALHVDIGRRGRTDPGARCVRVRQLVGQAPSAGRRMSIHASVRLIGSVRLGRGGSAPHVGRPEKGVCLPPCR